MMKIVPLNQFAFQREKHITGLDSLFDNTLSRKMTASVLPTLQHYLFDKMHTSLPEGFKRWGNPVDYHGCYLRKVDGFVWMEWLFDSNHKFDVKLQVVPLYLFLAYFGMLFKCVSILLFLVILLEGLPVVFARWLPLPGSYHSDGM